MGSIGTFGDSASAARSTAPLHCLLEKITDPEKISKYRVVGGACMGCVDLVAWVFWGALCWRAAISPAGLMAWVLCAVWVEFVACGFLLRFGLRSWSGQSLHFARLVRRHSDPTLVTDHWRLEWLSKVMT